MSSLHVQDSENVASLCFFLYCLYFTPLLILKEVKSDLFSEILGREDNVEI